MKLCVCTLYEYESKIINKENILPTHGSSYFWEEGREIILGRGKWQRLVKRDSVLPVMF